MIASKSTPNTANTRFVDAKVLMPQLGYATSSSFWAAVHQMGIPHIRLNRRKVIFETAAVEAWLDSRRVGGAH